MTRTPSRLLVTAAILLGLVLSACAGGGSDVASGPSSSISATSVTASTTTAPATTTTESVAPTRAAAAYGVGSRSMTVVDTSRPTRASPKRQLAAHSSRTLPLLVLYPSSGSADSADPVASAPVADGRFPILEFSHGVTATGPVYTGFLQQIAAAGYVVVAPTFPLTSGGGAWTDLGDYQNQPADVDFVLDQITALDRKAGDPLAGHLATDALAVGGHSLGAITTLGFFNGCCTDTRLRAAVEVSGTRLPYDAGSFRTASELPLLLVHGQKDGTVPYRGSKTTFDEFTGPRALVSYPAGTHISPVFPGAEQQVTVASVVAFLDLELRDDPTRWRALGALVDKARVATLAEAGGLPSTG